MRVRSSFLVQRYLSFMVAIVFLMIVSIWAVSTAHAQLQKTTPAPTKAPPTSETQTAPSMKAPPAAKLAPGEKVNINSASKEKLEALPGIGPVKAQAIIAGRPYAKPEDIMKVKGIKQGIYDKIKNQITTQ